MEFSTTSLLLMSILLLPLVGSIVFLTMKDFNGNELQKYTLYISLIVFILSLLLWIVYDPYQMTFQAIQVFSLPFLWDFSCLIGVDGISVAFIALTAFLFPLCILINWNQIQTNIKEYVISFLLLETFLVAVFCVLDLLLFYIFFESVLIPIFLFIGVWGSRERKIYAAYLLFLYTLVGSLVMLIGLLTIYYSTGTSDLQLLWSSEWSLSSQNLLWLAFFASFSVKIPMFPFHIWLPEAHVEAPTAGSVLLAGILLKLGGYGFIRFSIPMFPDANEYFLPLVYTLSIIGVIYTSLTTLRQTDLKRVIAYSSVGHMSLVVIGLFALNVTALEGALFLMLSHGVVSGGLFLCIGVLYHKHKTRIIKYYGGLVQVMPLFSTILFFLILANLSLPTTSSFVGEFMILLGAFMKNMWMTLLAGTTVILGACYSLWFFNRITFGNLNLSASYFFEDLSRKEFSLFLPLLVFVVLGGIIPNQIFAIFHGSSNYLLFPSETNLETFLTLFNTTISFIN